MSQKVFLHSTIDSKKCLKFGLPSFTRFYVCFANNILTKAFTARNVYRSGK